MENYKNYSFTKVSLGIISTLLLIALMLGVFGCKEQKPVELYSYSEKVVIAKTKEYRESSALTRSAIFYVIAFNDGHTENVRFGGYSCINVGDTIKFRKHIKGEWDSMVLNCN